MGNRFIGALIGAAALIAIGIVGSFLVLPAFYEASAADASAILLWLQVIFLLFSISSALFYAYHVLR